MKNEFRLPLWYRAARWLINEWLWLKVRASRTVPEMQTKVRIKRIVKAMRDHKDRYGHGTNVIEGDKLYCAKCGGFVYEYR